jgi:2-haloacid dehalogenase
MPALDYDRFDVLTFDCYGTLIDWDTGIEAALRRALPELGHVGTRDLLAGYAAEERPIEAGPYVSYREVLTEAARRIAAAHGVELSEEAAASVGASVGDWPAFPDSVEALARLKKRFRLGVITNCDDDLFAASHERLGGVFDWVVTAQQVGSYKPSHRNFEVAFERIGVSQERILHVAQGLFHDHVPANEIGLASVFIDRHHDREGTGASPIAGAKPDATFPSMQAFTADVLTP